jgi:glycine/D-amino acid oxidase-like deaminating enzyme
MHRRHILGGLAAAAATSSLSAFASDFAAPAPVAPIRARPDRVIDIAVATRPFRPQGPRIEAERLHGKTIVHNYGHGGSGWSLSWGSAKEALPLILATREKHLAVVGCGAIGLTTARIAQRAGLRVRIYCKDRPPEVRSAAATGVWSPDSRICTAEHATPGFVQRWETMARASFKTYQSLLGLPGLPVEWVDGYLMSDIPFDQPPPLATGDEEPEYAELEARIRDMWPRSVPLDSSQHPFHVPHVRRYTQLTFNLATYSRLLVDDFLREGGEIVHREFQSPRQLAGLKERTIVNATGYGARALFNDKTLVPVRGQTARLVPQPEVNYSLIYRGHNLVVVSRRDGLLVQAQGPHDYDNEDITPDRALTDDAVKRLAALFT